MTPFLVVTEVFSSIVETRVLLEAGLAREEWSVAIKAAARHEMTVRAKVILSATFMVIK